MKILKIVGVIGVVALLLTSTVQTHAIEGLNLSLQRSNVVLSWPSQEWENYIVQYRPTLDPSTPWQTLTSSLPADLGTNLTFFIHSNQVQYSDSGCDMSGGGESQAFSTALVDAVLAGQDSYFLDSPPMPPVPIRTSGVTVFVPWEQVYGQRPPVAVRISEHLRARVLEKAAEDTLALAPDESAVALDEIDSGGSSDPLDGPQPEGGGGEGGSSPEMGFYQVVRVGIHVMGLTNLTNGPVSDTILLPFEAGNASGTLHDLSVLVDGGRYRGSAPLVAPGISGKLSVDTTFLENGEHTFQIEGNWLNPDTSDENNYVFQQFSDQFALVVSNVICFPEWEDEVGELGFSAYFAKTTCTNANWQIDIYDVGSNLVQSLAGVTTDGVIETNWDMMDRYGVMRTNVDLDPAFSGIITVSDPIQKKLPPKVRTLPYPEHGRWVISFQDLFQSYYNSNNYYQAIYAMGSIGASFGGAVTFFPSDPTNAQTFPLRYSNTNNPVPIATMLKDLGGLRQLLTNSLSRNFYYVGHATANTLASYISAAEIQIPWFQNFDANKPRHYYRFVFLDACSSATGSLPAAFGINFNSPQQLSYFQKHGIRPRTFVGNNRNVYWCYPGPYSHGGVDYDGRIPEAVIYFLQNFEFYWYFNYDISTSIYYAINNTPYIGPGWNTGDHLQVYGYEWLRVDEYNHRGDWAN
jgi:hypothetical protein